MSSGTNEFCPRCGKAFPCRADDIAACGCSQITISEAMRERLAERYDRCVCPDCLRELSANPSLLREKPSA